MYKFYNDNIGYAIVEPKTKAILLVDPGDFESARTIVEKLEEQNGAKLKYILSTHSHEDHIGSNL